MSFCIIDISFVNLHPQTVILMATSGLLGPIAQSVRALDS